MKIALAEQVREIDKKAIDEYGIPEVVLMENAGVAVAQAVCSLFNESQGKKVVIFAGKGNNGGDAFVAARHLANSGLKVKVYIIGNAEVIVGSSRINLDVLQNMEIDILEIVSERDWDKMKIGLAFSDVVVDGLLGTGFSGALREDMVQVIQMINEAHKLVVSIDLPSGVAADSGQISSIAVEANITVTFALPKLGILLYPGARNAGEVRIIDIGLPYQLLSSMHIKQNMVNDKMVRKIMIQRPVDAHKGMCGKVLMIGGSSGMTGAICLAAEAALRVGAGVVTVAVAKSLHSIIETKLTEVMSVPLPENGAGALSAEALPALLDLAKKYDIVVIGPGLGRNGDTANLVRSFISETDKQLLIDADALQACALDTSILLQAKVVPILTPHLGEMAALIQEPVISIRQNLLETAKNFAEKFKSIVVLKSARTIVAYPDGNVYINTKGNAGMATAGSGDVLAGMVSGLFAQGLLSYSAAVAGVHLHALAGDIAAEHGKIGMVAGDILKNIPNARLVLDTQR